MTGRRGGCHCGRVVFEVEGEPAALLRCNCSICARRDYLHWIVARERFRLLEGEDALTTYTFNTGVAKHTSAACAASARSTCRARIPTGSA